jgi:hypothetical protein
MHAAKPNISNACCQSFFFSHVVALLFICWAHGNTEGLAYGQGSRI